MSITNTLSKLERIVLPQLSSPQTATELVTATKLQDVEVIRALQWLSNKRLVTIKEEKQDLILLDENGMTYRDSGLPERRALSLLAEHSHTVDSLIKHSIAKEEVNIIIGSLKKKAAINITKEGKTLTITITENGKKLLAKPSLEEAFLKKNFPLTQNSLNPEERFAFDNLKTRKRIIKTETKKTVTASATKEGLTLIKKGISKDAGADRITPKMLKDGSWKDKKFRTYDVTSKVPAVTRGRTHFVNDAIHYAKRIWLDMGFKEMTGKHIQTAFWDLDALFVPQDHPAREEQDTFYLQDPKSGTVKDQKTWKRVAAVHENGGDTGSKGWQTPFDGALSLLNMLRTHTTVLSAQTLARIKKEQLPMKFFVVGKVYRNETLDWKHLFEFHQVDGIVIDPSANLRHLKGYLEEFYRKMGFDKIRIRPAHFPYTEPSIEVEVYNKEKNEWIEMGGAGIFRPEVTKTLLGEEIPVLAWGQGLERIIMPYYGFNDIRHIYHNDLKQLRTIKEFIR